MTLSLTILTASATLLLAPGPTNVLFAAAGAGLGARRALWLTPVGLAAYLLSIGLLVATLGSVTPALRIGIQLAAGAYLAWGATRLWTGAHQPAVAPAATPSRMFWTTGLNPKTTIFAFSLYPETGAATGLAIFVPLFLLAAVLWIGMGHVAAASASRGRIARATALANMLFATIAVGSAVRVLV